MYGDSPKKLLNKINLNKFTNKKVDPLKELFPNKILNSLCNVVKMLAQINKIREGMIQ